LAGNIGRPDMGPFVEGKETFGNTLRAKIAKRGGFLSPVALGKVSSSNASPSNFGDFDETKSVRSNARSLAITSPKQVNIGKVYTAPSSNRQSLADAKNLRSTNDVRQ